jgi:hypothetical protein
VLINRINAHDGSLGRHLVRALKADRELASLPVMLLSDHAAVQAQAIALGAVPGFGKSRRHEPETRELLCAALDVPTLGGAPTAPSRGLGPSDHPAAPPWSAGAYSVRSSSRSVATETRW